MRLNWTQTHCPTTKRFILTYWKAVRPLIAFKLPTGSRLVQNLLHAGSWRDYLAKHWLNGNLCTSKLHTMLTWACPETISYCVFWHGSSLTVLPTARENNQYQCLQKPFYLFYVFFSKSVLKVRCEYNLHLDLHLFTCEFPFDVGCACVADGDARQREPRVVVHVQ